MPEQDNGARNKEVKLNDNLQPSELLCGSETNVSLKHSSDIFVRI